MDYKFPFLSLSLMMIVAGLTPFIWSAEIEPSMEIDMLADQTQYPFRIQDSQNQNVFAVKPNGGLDPLIVTRTEYVLANSIYDEWFPTWTSSSPATICPNAESGTGVYQFSHIVVANNVDSTVDSNRMFTSDEFITNFTFQMENIDSGTIGMGYKVFVNDVEVATRTDASVSAGNFLYGQTQDRERHNGRLSSVPYIQAGDEIGWKCFQTSGTSDSLRLNHIWLQGFPVLTTDALNISLSFVDYTLHTVSLRPTVPASMTGETLLFWNACMTVVSNDWEQCWGRNAFTGDFEVSIGAEVMYVTIGETLTENSADRLYVIDDEQLRNGFEVAVVAWK